MNSNERRSNIRRARERDPIVSIFMVDNPNRCYSISVPSSKDWNEFIIKIKNKFNLSLDSSIQIYQAPLHMNDDNINTDEMHEYDINDSDMSKIKHQWVFCIKLINDDRNNELNKNENVNNNNTKKNKRKSKKQRRRSRENSTSDSSTNSNSNSSNDGDEQEEEHKQNNDEFNSNPNDVNESQFGLDLDIFGRFPQSKKQNRSKTNNKAIYHYHRPELMHNLDYHVKETWLNFKTKPMKVHHENDKYTIMNDEKNEFTLRTRRMIWPRNLQHQNEVFDYNLDDIRNKFVWAILIIHGGKFAGAVYRGNELILHKTLRRYVIRKKQGKRQINHLSQGGRGGSAGGYKRAWNEKKLLEEIREILSNWMDVLLECDKIFIHCPGNYNLMTIYGNNEEQTYLYPENNNKLNFELSKERLSDVRNKNKNKYTNLYRLYRKDERIQQIPITTYNVTLGEIERVHYWLSTCWLKKNNKNETNENEIK